jgi:DNA-3-methyladenine glycosylase
MSSPTLPQDFFNQEPIELAQSLLGKVLRHRIDAKLLAQLSIPADLDIPDGPVWLSARIIETEAYYLHEKGSHSSQGFTESRKAMFMEPGTIYMYYARGGDSLNFSARGEGNGVLIKSGLPYFDRVSPRHTLRIMQHLNPAPSSGIRHENKLCRGQTLLCRSLALKVPAWNQKAPDRRRFRLDDTGYTPARYVQARRLGIPQGRDEHLPYRFLDLEYARHTTSNPLTKRDWREGIDFKILPFRAPSDLAH